ncbi:exodeoxyribonuclease V subunit gamma [Buchnera aphidicola (Nippolachnus piri)]|uniref:exodeoxyribonuclease V subunit gamma n=1 Tax=Buchnera aphidicola TaxID=9 RepID=UPI0031B71870
MFNFKKKKKKNVLEPDFFLIDNLVVKKWIQIFIAKKMKISANIKFISCQKYLINFLETQNLYNTSFPSYFKKQDLIWILIFLEEKKKINLKFLKTTTLSKKTNFCILLATIFHTYLIDDPTNIFNWEKNLTSFQKNFIFQKKIWRKIIKYFKKKYKKLSFTKTLKKFISYSNFKKKNNNIPKRLFIFSTELFKPLNIFILMYLKKYTNIYILEYVSVLKDFLCYEIKKKKKLNLNYISSNNISDFFWSSQKKFFKIKRRKFFYISSNTILQIVQKKNLYFQKYNESNHFKNIQKNIFYSNQDNSFYISRSYSKREEVENIFNYLLIQFQNNITLQPHEILITSPNIKKYFIHINNIFKNFSIQNKFKIHKKNKYILKKKKILFIFKKILTLSFQEFEHEWIINLLDLSFIRKKFLIKKKEIKILYFLLEKIGKFWGYNKKHFKKMSLPYLPFHSWEYFIKRIITGILLKSKDKIWLDTLPYNIQSQKYKILLGHFINFLETLNKWRCLLSSTRNLKNWIVIIKKLIQEIFKIPEKWKKFFNMLHKNFLKNIQVGIFLNYKKKISIKILLNKNFLNLTPKKYYKNFFSGTINIGNINLSYNLPFKIICILGCHKLKDSTISKKNSITLFKKNFNILHDIYRNLKNKNFFFDTIMSTKKCLYLSYKISKNRNILLPMFLEELKEFFQNIFLLKKFQKKKTILNNIFISSENLSFKKNENLNSINFEKKKIIKKKYHINKKFSHSLNLKHLIKFWKSPIQYFFTEILNIKTNFYQNTTYSLNEPFLINPLNKYLINKKFLNMFLYKKKIKFEYFQKKSILPNNKLGKIYWKIEKKKMKNLSKKIIKKINIPKKLNFTLSLNKITLTGTIKNIHNFEIIRWIPLHLKTKNIMSLWLEHLTYSALGYQKESFLYSLDKKYLKFSIINKKKAQEYLLQYLNGYYMGIKKPLLLLESGIKWLNSIYFIKNNILKKKNINKNLKNKIFQKTWNGNFLYPGEKKNIYIQKIIPILTPEKIKKIKKISKYWWFPLLKSLYFIK